MSEWYLSLAQTFGPWVQLFYACFIALLIGNLIAYAAFRGEQTLLQTQKRGLWLLPFPVLLSGILYGIFRVLGVLLYAADGWDSTGMWNYTNQNRGAAVIFVSVWLFAGTILAVRKAPVKDR